jgi:hypothetical protein
MVEIEEAEVKYVHTLKMKDIIAKHHLKDW